LLTYQLEFLERNNNKEVTIITNENFSKNIIDFLLSYEGKLQIKILKTSNRGINILNSIKNEIKHNNFVLMSIESLLYFDLFKLVDEHIDNRLLIILVLNNYNCDTQKLNFLKKKEIESNCIVSKIIIPQI
jgi:NDP-sugar pyrophosphorylase family protein